MKKLFSVLGLVLASTSLAVELTPEAVDLVEALVKNPRAAQEFNSRVSYVRGADVTRVNRNQTVYTIVGERLMGGDIIDSETTLRITERQEMVGFTVERTYTHTITTEDHRRGR